MHEGIVLRAKLTVNLSFWFFSLWTGLKAKNQKIRLLAPIAQRIEYPASNRVVGGSSPLRCIFHMDGFPSFFAFRAICFLIHWAYHE